MAEDLAVETFVTAYRAWGSFRGDGDVSAWLRRIAVDKCTNRRDRRDDRSETTKETAEENADD
jgi:DNA-directed RNA polymerase specialized sigma24 family protein